MKISSRLKKLIIIITIAICMNGYFTVRAAQEGIPYCVAVEDGQAVWMTYGNDNWDVYYQDLSSDVIKQITNDPKDQSLPNVDGNYIVWLDNRNNTDNSIHDVYLYNLLTNVEEKITNKEGNYGCPVVESNHVFWSYNHGIEEAVEMYDINSKMVKTISSVDAIPLAIKAQGQYVVWTDARNGNIDLYMYNLSTDTEQQITQSPEDEYNFYMDQQEIIWEVEYNDVNQIYSYDITSGYISRITTGLKDHIPLAFSDGNIIMKEDGEVIKTNTETSITIPLDVPITGTVKGSFLDGDQLIWFDGLTFTQDSLSQSINRVEVQVQVAQEPLSSEDNRGNKQIIVEDTYNISIDEDVFITLNKGSYNKVEFTKAIGKLDQPNFKLDSDLYSWQIDKTTSDESYTMTFKSNSDNKEIWPYILQDGNITPLLGTRDKSNNLITVTIPKEGQVALMTHDNRLMDISDHWAKETIRLLASRMIINGYSDNSFRPDSAISRAEFTTMLIKSIEGQQTLKEKIFDDINEDNWASPYITTAYKKGWIKGNSTTLFGANELITREQLVTILMRIYNDLDLKVQQQNLLSQYNDNNQISLYARDYMEQGIQLGIIKGYDNNLNPKGKTTRAEAAVFLSRFLDLLNKI